MLTHIKNYVQDIVSLFTNTSWFWLLFFGPMLIIFVMVPFMPFAKESLVLFSTVAIVAVVAWFWSFCYMLLHPFLK